MAADDRKNQGEGDYEAARRYREQVAEHKADKDIDAEARKAKEAKEGRKGSELTDAEAKGKARAREMDPETKKP